jgi:pimeloyl-ACP methyl ester carboxylesterase
MRILHAAVVALALLAPASAAAPRQDVASALALKPCTAGRGRAAECGTLIVPENRQTGRGRRIGINFIVFRSATPGAKEAAYLLAGGPGQGSTAMTGTATGWMSSVLDTMDIVLMDQRGTGGSNPLACESDIAANPAKAFGHVSDPEVIARCRAALEPRADLTQYTTDAAVADMEDIRRALGYERIALYGGSYGTRIAQAYLRRHPSRTKSAVIDGVVPFEVPPPINYARSLQQSIERVFESCRANAECRAAHPRLAEDFQSLLARFDRAPVQTTVRGREGLSVPVTMTKHDFAYAVRGMLYSAGTVRDMPALITNAAASGDVSEFAQRYWSRAVNMGRSIARGMHLSVFCAEDIPYATDAEIDAATANTFMGRYVFDDYRRACALWPRGTIAADYRTPVTARVPVLIVSGRYDPVTPPEWGDRIARSLPLARHVVSPTGSHGSASGCPRAAALHVLIKGTLDGMPPVCQ